MEMEMEEDVGALLAGRHPVLEALRQGRPMSKIWLQSGQHEGSLREIIGLAESHRIPIQYVPKSRLDLVAKGLNHQGVVASVSAHSTLSLEELGALVRDVAQPVLLLLDGVQDPHNLGAVLRVAAASGIHGVVIPERGAVGLTPAVAKVSAGAIEHVPVARVVNLANAVETIQSWGFFVFAADPGARLLYHQVDWNGPVAFVIGSEGKGVRPLVKARCDGDIRIPMLGQMGSLNASTAAAVIAFEIVRHRQLTP